MTARDLLTRLDGVRSAGSQRWMARCPAHDDKDPSLSVTDRRDRVLVHCHAGCEPEDIVEALGLELKDLYSGNGDRPEIEATYDYVDEDGELLFQVVRLTPKSFRQRRPDGSGGWEWSTRGVRRVLYRLPKVLKAVSDGRLVHVVEGEKDVAAIERAGGVATTAPGGAGRKWRPEFSEPLEGARVRIVADDDPAGRAHVRKVARALDGVAGSVEVVLPASGNDAHDHLAAGHGLDDWRPWDGEGEAAAEEAEDDAPVFVSLADLLHRPELLEPPEVVVPRIAYRGRATLLAGPDKSGKSTLLAHAAAALSRREKFLSEPFGLREGQVLWVGLEEAVADAVRRFGDHGARGEWIRMVVAPPSDLLARIGEALEAAPVDLVVVDSLAEYARVTSGAAPDNGDAAGWGAVVRPLIALVAREHDAALVVLHHTRRADGEYRGSSEIAAAVDLLLELRLPKKGQDPNVRRITGRGRWGKVDYSVALRDGVYTLAGGTELSRDALILLHVKQHPGCSLRSVRDAVTGAPKVISEAVEELIARGALQNLGGEGRWALHPATLEGQ